MRTCPHCSHHFDEAQAPPSQCPKCGKSFTVSDVGAMTIDLGTSTLPDPPQPPPTPPKLDATIESSLFAPPSTSAPTVSDPPSGKPEDKPGTYHDLGATTDGSQFLPPQRTISGKPTDKPATYLDLGATTDSSLLMPSTPGDSAGPKDKTYYELGATIQAGKFVPSAAEMAEALNSGSSQAIEGTIELRSQVGIAPVDVRDLTHMWDSSIASSQPGAPAATLQSGQVSSGGASGAGSQSMASESLEQSLVIQPRVLRPETTPGDAAASRIDYNLLKKLGEGGMGIVYAARQSSIRRTVALKMLKPAGAQQAAHREKFLAEAVITGDLEHPNIVPIYDLGRDEAGAIFYAMKHVKGIPWDKSVKTKSLPENLETLLKVADAVAFAHSKDVVHRDLKPENVMLGDFGEVLVMDWGLALSITNPPATFAMGGTPAYMAPEMAFGPAQLIGFGSDVYLLGAILYEIVTGLRPHTGNSVTRCLMAAAKNEIVPAPKGGELVEIALKAMATKPEDRYKSVRDFQLAIRQYQSHTESIALAARAQDDLEEGRKTDSYDTFARALFGYQEAFNLWDGNARAKTGAIEAALAYAQSAQRKGDFDLGLSLLDKDEPQHQELIGELKKSQAERESRQRRLRTARRVGVALVAAIFMIVTGAFFWIRSEAERANRERDKAVAARTFAEEQQAKAVAAQKEEAKQRKFAEEQQAKAIAAQQEEAKQRKFAEEQQAKAVAAQIEEQKQRKLADEQKAAAVAAQLAAEEARKKEEYEGYIAKIGLAAAKIEENAFDHALALLSECPPHLRNWEWGRLNYLCTRNVKSFDAGQPLEAVAVSPDGKTMAAGGWGSDVKLIDIASGNVRHVLPTGATYVFALAFSPDGTQLAIGSNSRPEFVSLWDVAGGKRLRGLAGHKDAVLSVAFSKDGQKLLTGSYDNTARLFDLARGTSREFAGHDWWVWSAAFSPDEQRIVTGSQDGSAIVWNVVTGEASPPFLGHDGPVYSAAFSPDGQHVATGSYDKRILLWKPADLRSQDIAKVLAGAADAPPPTPYTPLEEHSAAVRSVRFSSDGRLLLSSGNDNALCVWDVASHKLAKKLRGHASRVSSAVFVPGDDRVVSGAYDHTARLWSISKYEEVRVLGGRVLKGHRDSILGAAFSPDGQTVVTASRDRSAIAWNVATGQQLRSYEEGHAYLASAALFFPDGKRVLTSAVDNTTRIWDVAAGTELASLVGTGSNAAVALTSAGNFIVTGSDDKAIKIWDPAGKLLRRFDGLKSDVTSLAVAPGDQLLLTGDTVGRIRLLRLADGEPVWEARSHSRAITAVAFVPGAGRVVSASLDNTCGQWDAATGMEDKSRILKHPDAVTSLAVSFDGKQALTACADKIVRLWDLDKAAVLKAFPATEIATTDVAFSPDGRRALATSADNRLRLFDLNAGTEIPSPEDKKSAFLDLSATTLLVWSAAFSADGDRILTVGGAEAHLWETTSARQLMTFSPQSAVSSVQFSQKGDRLVTGSWDNAARIWNSATGAGLVKLGGVHTRFVNASVFSPDGSKVLTASDDGTVRMWDAAAGKPLASFVGHEGRVTDVAFSSDGKWVLTASDDKTARLWNAATSEVIHVLKGHEQAVLCAEFSADDKRIITGSDDTTALLWDATTGKQIEIAPGKPIVLAGHTASVTSVAFTPDGLRALTGSKDITTKLWDPATGKEILTLAGHTQEITTVAVATLGSSILTGSRDGTAIVWLASDWKPAPPAGKEPVAAAVSRER